MIAVNMQLKGHLRETKTKTKQSFQRGLKRKKELEIVKAHEEWWEKQQIRGQIKKMIVNVCIYMHTHGCIYTHKDVCIANIHIYVHVCMHTDIHTWLGGCVQQSTNLQQTVQWLYKIYIQIYFICSNESLFT